MEISYLVPPSEHDSAIGSQVDEMLRRGLDSALKLSLLSEAWILTKGTEIGGTVADFSTRLGYAEDLVRQELNQLAKYGYFARSCSDDRLCRYLLTEQAPRLQTVRRLLASWRDVRFYVRANAKFAFRPAPGTNTQQ